MQRTANDHPAGETSSLDICAVHITASDFRLLFKSVPDPCLVLDPQLRIVAVNDTYLRNTMTKREEILGRSIFEVFPDNPAEPDATGVSNLSASLNRVLANRAPDTMAIQKYDIRRPAEEGGSFEERYWSPINTPVFGEDGEIVYIIHRSQDITEFVHFTQKGADPGRRAAMPGHPRTKVRGYGKRGSVFAAEDELHRHQKQLFELLEERTRANERLTAANLEIKRLNSALAKHSTELEQQVAERTMELRESEMRFRSLVTASSNIVYRMNPDWSEMYQLRGQNFIADTDKPKRNWLQEYIHPDDQAHVMTVINEAIRTKSIFELEHRVLRVDGTLGWTFSRAIPLLDASGKIFEWFGAASDISERKLAEEALKKMNEELERLVAERTADLNALNADLERSNKDLELFASVASHDLQEPLRTITSYVEILAQEYQEKLDKQANEYMAYILDGTSHLHTLINDLLAYSRVGTRAKPFTPVRMDAVLDQALNGMKKTIAESNTMVERDKLPEVQGDDVQLAQLFRNLIANAIKFRKNDTESQIRVTIKKKGGEWVFGVHDNGIGIAPQYFGRIFQVFRRLHTREEYEGSGMGLAICRKIVEHHGGRIWVESVPGEGSSFYFTLPAKGGSHEE